MAEKLSFKAHARLLTMLGEQLITNERVALVEIVKNAYDADADRVTVDFRGFAPDFTPLPGSSIAITDNGVGMTESLVRTAWMNPATPSKALVKRGEPETVRGRVLQGEKGIGRFATFKLGTDVTLVTRAKDQPQETTLVVDIAELDESDAAEAPRADLYLEDIAAIIDHAAPKVFMQNGLAESVHGTQLVIRGLRAPWSDRLVRQAFADLDRLQPLMWPTSETAAPRSDFDVTFLRDGTDMRLAELRTEEFSAILQRAVLQVRQGRFDPEGRLLSFNVNGRAETLSIDDALVRALKPFKDHFLKDDKGKDLPPETLPMFECGPFGFEFFIFDFGNAAPAKNSLDKSEKDNLREHRIYLYRDNIRVYPYGDRDDDWLEIDVQRGTESAGRTFSNDQVIGYVTITQANNRNLRDKTNREGLLESGAATQDFKALIQTVLRYLRAYPFERYASANRRVRERGLKQHRLDKHLSALRTEFDLPPKALRQIDALEKALDAERSLSSTQVARTEQLAGVGLSVETAAHDLILSGAESLRLAKQVVSELALLDLKSEPVYAVAGNLVTRLEFVSARFKDVQGLFVSTRQTLKPLDIVQYLKRVRSIYSRLHEQQGIIFEIDDGAILRAASTEAAVLQCLINLVDNATYWLMASTAGSRTIRAFTPDDETLVLSDSGPGVRDEDAPFIFEAFYSGKGQDGKGLGLYIARQNGLRNAFQVELIPNRYPRQLAGASFAVRFGDHEDANVDS